MDGQPENIMPPAPKGGGIKHIANMCFHIGYATLPRLITTASQNSALILNDSRVHPARLPCSRFRKVQKVPHIYTTIRGVKHVILLCDALSVKYCSLICSWMFATSFNKKTGLIAIINEISLLIEWRATLVVKILMKTMHLCGCLWKAPHVV